MSEMTKAMCYTVSLDASVSAGIAASVSRNGLSVFNSPRYAVFTADYF